ncbi:MAG: peptide deformylase [Deltaproteobacteria bacterium]|jgi:peptide deformylase|nr:peptide deformylase [Deltaproteobacteria bacterium]HBI28643.1 peptide deformylase [Deltaproteobacteria bacterium]|tara:strand:+ start:113 stop:631 length:519 start_codon:yes stop_codon:yes gene_type:complete
MALLQVRTFPDSILKQVAKPVEVFDTALRKTAENMLETMYASQGIGLAANQVAILKRLVVIDIKSGAEDESERDPHIFVNPNIIEQSGETISEEGCLSVEEFRAEVKRAERITLEYQDVVGQPHTLAAEGLMAICIQHELDHLRGVLFIDHLPPLKQKMVKRRLAKQARLSA